MSSFVSVRLAQQGSNKAATFRGTLVLELGAKAIGLDHLKVHAMGIYLNRVASNGSYFLEIVR